MNLIKKYFIKGIVILCAVTILFGFWFQYILKGNWGNIFPKRYESKIGFSQDGRIVPMTLLSEEDLKKSCVECHKK